MRVNHISAVSRLYQYKVYDRHFPYIIVQRLRKRPMILLFWKIWRQTLYVCITFAENTDAMITPGRRQSKTSILSTNVNKNSLKTEFLIAICRLTGDKWQSKTLFLAIFDPRSSIVKSVFDCRLPGVVILRSSCIY